MPPIEAFTARLTELLNCKPGTEFRRVRKVITAYHVMRCHGHDGDNFIHMVAVGAAAQRVDAALENSDGFKMRQLILSATYDARRQVQKIGLPWIKGDPFNKEHWDIWQDLT